MSRIDVQKCSGEGNEGQRLEGDQVAKVVIEPVHLDLGAISHKALFDASFEGS